MHTPLLFYDGFQSVVIVEGVCRVPSDYLSPLPNDTTRFTSGGRVYIYADTFANCSGCVTALSVCYTVFSDMNFNPTTVMILDDQNTIVHMHDFNGPANTSDDQDTDCNDFDLFSDCCTHKKLTPSEQFIVQSDHHYGIWSQNALPSHPTLMAPGNYVLSYSIPLEVGVNTTVHSIPRIYFHFVISPGTHFRTSLLPHASSILSSILFVQYSYTPPGIDTLWPACIQVQMKGPE